MGALQRLRVQGGTRVWHRMTSLEEDAAETAIVCEERKQEAEQAESDRERCASLEARVRHECESAATVDGGMEAASQSSVDEFMGWSVFGSSLSTQTTGSTQRLKPPELVKKR